MGVVFWPSKIRDRLNRLPWAPERITGRVCVNPYYPCRVESWADVLMDSGAFQDVSKGSRLSFPEALQRQLDAETKLGRPSTRVVSYDRLVDEQHINGRQVKERWSTGDALSAVEETIAAAAYLSEQRNRLDGRQLLLSCQGVTIAQYEECARAILAFARPGDCFGFGGFCIVGQRRAAITDDGVSFLQQYHLILEKVMPLLREAGIREAHVFGVMYRPAMLLASVTAAESGILISTDSSAVERRSVIAGGVWDESECRFTRYLEKADKWPGESEEVPAGKWHPNLLARDNIGRAARSLLAI